MVAGDVVTEASRQRLVAAAASGRVTTALRMRLSQTRRWLASLARVGQAFARCSGVVLSIALLPLPTWADSPLEEIVVTAQRQKENAQDVPVAVSAFTSKDLERAGVRQAGDIANLVPNLILASPYGTEAQPTFALRGVTTNDFSQNQSSPIAMYVDDVYKSVGALQAVQTYDLDRVEVLRGPQGTLYGKNATGGAVSFFTRNPSLDSYDGYLTLGAGNYSDYTVQGAVGGPIIDHELGWRAAMYYEKRDGWLHSIEPGVPPANGIDVLAGRLSFLAKPNDSLSVLLKAAVSRSGGTPYGARPINVEPSVTGTNPNISWFQNAAVYAVNKTIDNDSISLKMDWQISDHYTLTSVTGYDYGRWVEIGDDGNVGALIYGLDTYASTVNSYSQELRIASHDTGKLSWLGGVYYGGDSTHAWLQYHYFDAYPGSFVTNAKPPVTLYGYDQANSFDQIRTSAAAFLNATYKIEPTVTVRGGLRFTRDTMAIRNFYALEGGLATAPVNNAPDQPDLWTPTIPYVPGTSFVDFTPGAAPKAGTAPDLIDNTTNLSFKVGIDWKPDADTLYYASISRGYRGAAFNGQAFNSPLELNFARPETLTAYEIGSKHEFLAHRLQLNVAAFYYDYRNEQFLDNFAGPTGPLFHTINSPKSRSTGAEFELRFKATDDLELRGNLGLLDAKYVDLTLRGLSRAGNRIVMSPKTNVSGTIDWRVAEMSSADLHLDISGNYYSKQFFDALNTERIAQSGYALANARATVNFGPTRQYSVSAWIKNITNREYLTYALALRNPADGGLGLDYSVVGEPRTFGVTAGVKF